MAALFIISRKENSKCLRIEWIHETWYSHTMEYIGNRNKVLIHTMVRVNLKNVMLKSKKSNTNDHIVMRFHEFHGI